MLFSITPYIKSRHFDRSIRGEYAWYSEIAKRLSESDFHCDAYTAIMVGFTDLIEEGGIKEFPNSDGYLQFNVGVAFATGREFRQSLLNALSDSFDHFFPNRSETTTIRCILEGAETELRTEEAE